MHNQVSLEVAAKGASHLGTIFPMCALNHHEPRIMAPGRKAIRRAQQQPLFFFLLESFFFEDFFEEVFLLVLVEVAKGATGATTGAGSGTVVAVAGTTGSGVVAAMLLTA